ncbi:hypothetical protein HDV00_009575 [Rhizophlyctis rosea]|nr:hypothetical protein HDV00_009575 [Rhizophlyctis rosea]
MTSGSVGFHGDDGGLFIESTSGRRFGNIWKKGDRVGFGIKFGTGEFFFTANGSIVQNVIPGSMKRATVPVSVCIGFKSPGARVSIHVKPGDQTFNAWKYFKIGSQTIESVISPRSSTESRRSTSSDDNSTLAKQFVRLPVMLCSACATAEFPSCPTHNALMMHPEGTAQSSCIIRDCNRSTSEIRTCKGCGAAPGDFRMLCMTIGECVFWHGAIQKERTETVPLAVLVCSDCRAVEVPGMGDYIINLVEALEDERAKLVVKATIMKFSHRASCTGGVDTVSVEPWKVSKSSITDMVEKFVRSAKGGIMEDHDNLIPLSRSVLAADDITQLIQAFKEVFTSIPSVAATQGSSNNQRDPPLPPYTPRPSEGTSPAGKSSVDLSSDASSPSSSSSSPRLTSPSILETTSLEPCLASQHAVLMITAPWCVLSRDFAEEYTALALAFPSIMFYKMDGYTDTDLRAEMKRMFQVTSYPTFVLFRNGKALKRRIKGADAEELREALEDLV